MSRKHLVVALVSAVLICAAVAQTSVNSQGSVSGSSQSSVSASGGQAQASSNTGANVSQSANMSHEHQGSEPKSAQSSASAAGAAGSSTSAGAGKGNASLANGTTMNAVLSKSVDSGHCKPGDEVTAKVSQDVKSNGQVVIPKHSKLVGHVTEAKVKEKGDAAAQSTLGIAFDHAVLKNGQQVPTNVVIQALAAAQTSSAGNLETAEPMGGAMGGGAMAGGAVRGGGGLVGGVGSSVGGAAGVAGGATGDVGRTAGSVVNTSASTAGSVAGHAGGALSATGQLTSQSTGVFGLNGLQLAGQASSATQGSLITSAGKSVKLESGTQMLLRVANQ